MQYSEGLRWGTIFRRKSRGLKAHKLDWAALRAGIDQKPERMMTEWAKEFSVVPASIHDAMRRINLSRKKNVAA